MFGKLPAGTLGLRSLPSALCFDELQKELTRSTAIPSAYSTNGETESQRVTNLRCGESVEQADRITRVMCLLVQGRKKTQPFAFSS